MNSLTKREKYLLIVVGIVALIFVYGKWFLLPVIDDIKVSRQKIEEYHMQLSQIKTMELENEKMEQELASTKTKYQDALKQLPVVEKNPEIAYNLKPLADGSNVNLNGVTLSQGTQYTIKQEDGANEANSNQAEQDGNFYSIPVSINISGSNYINIMDFIDALEGEKRFTEINSISISKQQDALKSMSASMNINYFCTLTNSKEKPEYDFNNGSYGKSDIFK